MRTRLGRLPSIGFALCMISCATAEPKYLVPGNLSGISTVAVVTSATAPDVTYSTRAPGAGLSGGLVILSPLLGLGAMGIEALARTAADQGHGQEVGKGADPRRIEEAIARQFIAPLAKADRFARLEYLALKTLEDRRLTEAGYDALITLVLRQISLERAVGDSVSLHIRLSGQMKVIRSGSVVWEREEVVRSLEASSLEYYKSGDNLLRHLDNLLEKAAQRLAYDFMYLK